MRRGVNWLILGTVGVVLIIAVVLFNVFLVPWAIHYQVGNTLALKNGSDAWQRFIKVPVDIYLKIYIFNVENPEDVVIGAKPVVKEVGPYVYRELRTKDVVGIKEDRDTVEYYQTLTFHFEKNLSLGLSEEDTVHILNPVMIGMMQIVESMPLVENLEPILDFGLGDVLGPVRNTPVMTTTVRELLFDGFPLYCNQSSPGAATRLLCSSFKRIMPLKLLTFTDDGNFNMALLGYKNATAEGPFEVGSGVKKIEDLGRLKTWKGSEVIPAWGGAPCNVVKGSDASLLPPFLSKSDYLYIFNTDICTATQLTYKELVSYKDIPGYRFVPSPDFLTSIEENKDNYCYCPGSIKGLTKPSGCLRKGLLDVSSCLQVPGLVTFPHLWKADTEYVDMIEGLHPDPDKHSTYFDIEPTSGVPLRGYQRVQVNLLSKKTKSIKQLEYMPTAVFPLIWMEEGFQLGESEVQMVRDQLLKVLTIVNIIMWVLIGCGILMAAVGFVMAYIRLRKN